MSLPVRGNRPAVRFCHAQLPPGVRLAPENPQSLEELRLFAGYVLRIQVAPQVHNLFWGIRSSSTRVVATSPCCDPFVDATHIEVNVKDGEVTLEGELAHWSNRSTCLQ